MRQTFATVRSDDERIGDGRGREPEHLLGDITGDGDRVDDEAFTA